MLKRFKRKSSSKKEAKNMAETFEENVQPREGELVETGGAGNAEDPEKQTTPMREALNEYMYVSHPVNPDLTYISTNVKIRSLGWAKTKELSEEGYVKGKIALQKGIGLGAKPNTIPPGEARLDADLRPVEIGWHPVAGMGGKWLAEQTGLGRKITASIGKYPDPTQHWAVLVGDFAHQLVSLGTPMSKILLMLS